MEYGLFVTSNKSNSHIVFGDTDKTPCGLEHRIMGTNHPNSEVRWYMGEKDFKAWIAENRQFQYDGYRLCKRCLKAYDKLQFINSAPGQPSSPKPDPEK